MIEYHKYGMRLRGYAPMCQPKEGLLYITDDMSGKYWNILTYDRPLTDKELRDYELDRIPEKENDMRTPIANIKRCPYGHHCGTCMHERRDKEDNSFCTIYTGKEPETQEKGEA